MTALPRRRLLRQVFGAVALGGAAGVLLQGAREARAQAEARVVDVEARKFRFSPNEIVLKRGVAVTLAFTAIDFVHGFSVPELGLRADLRPGHVTRVRLEPLAAGRYDFLCDNFCGDGHENMHGVLVVVD